MELEFHLVPANKQSAESVWHIPDAVCTVLDSWWWTERPYETCRLLLQNKINLNIKLVHLVGFNIERNSFYTLSHKQHDFRKGAIENKMCVLIFSRNFIWKVSHSKKISTRHSHQCTPFFMYSTSYCFICEQNLNFFDRFLKNY